MNKIGILKDVAYGAKQGGGTVAAGEWGLLAQGAIGIFNPSKGTFLLGDVTNAAAALGDSKNVRIAVGRAGNKVSIFDVPRNLRDLNRVNSRAFTKPVITVGGITAPLTLAFENTGDISVKVLDTTYSSRFGIPAIHADVYKTAGMTSEQAVDAIVAKLNAHTAFGGVTATKVKDGTSTYFGITITPKLEDVQIEVALDGMWAGASIVQTTAPVYGIGAASAIAVMEKEMNIEEGDGNYIEYGAEHFSAPSEVVAARYDVTTLLYDAFHSGPVNKRHVSSNSLVLATVNGASTFNADGLATILAAVFPNYASTTAGQEIGAGSGTDNDGTSGN